MDRATRRFRQVVDDLAGRWLRDGLPSRQTMMETAVSLDQMRSDLKVKSLWHQAPRILTATLDDGIGQGLTVIEAFAAAIGMTVIPIGLMQTPDIVIDACRQHVPRFLGLTVLQFDTKDDLLSISKALPTATRIVAGGPVFSADPDFAGRTGIHFAARHVADFLRIMLATATSPTPT
ncbi:MAG: hypothetical protein CSA23_07290 [Deltaproteobacteria bacterium]|nr:MAG: hypothetical protein CSA23_07290 [Deltaproteobacteria bacterium]